VVSATDSYDHILEFLDRASQELGGRRFTDIGPSLRTKWKDSYFSRMDSLNYDRLLYIQVQMYVEVQQCVKLIIVATLKASLKSNGTLILFHCPNPEVIRYLSVTIKSAIIKEYFQRQCKKGWAKKFA
jgi:hypothetical protein